MFTTDFLVSCVHLAMIRQCANCLLAIFLYGLLLAFVQNILFMPLASLLMFFMSVVSSLLMLFMPVVSPLLMLFMPVVSALIIMPLVSPLLILFVPLVSLLILIYACFHRIRALL
jgi:hypothetical protein